MTPDEQPDEGQGSEATGSPYDSYLSTVPDDARPAAEEWFKDTSKGLDAKLQELAEYKQNWEPFGSVREALAPYAQQPELLNERLTFLDQVTSSPEAYQEWIAQEAEQAGFTKAEAQELEDASETGELTPERVQQIIDERMQQQLGPLQEQQEELQKARITDQIEQDINSEWRRLEGENKTEFSDSTKKRILDLGMDYDGEGSWVQYGFDRLKESWAEGQKMFVADKSSQPQTPIPTGGVEAAQAPTSFSEASKLLRERLRQQT